MKLKSRVSKYDHSIIQEAAKTAGEKSLEAAKNVAKRHREMLVSQIRYFCGDLGLDPDATSVTILLRRLEEYQDA